MNRIGGVNRDIEDPIAILAMVEALEGEMARKVIPIFTTSSTARSRCAGVGVLTHEKAISCGVVGPVARASGVPRTFAVPLPTRPMRKSSSIHRSSRTAMCAPVCWSAPLRSWRAPAPPPGPGKSASGRARHRRRTQDSFSAPEPQPAAWKRRAAKSCTACHGKKARESVPRACAHAHLRGDAGSPLDGAGRAAGRHAADPGLHRPVLFLHRPLDRNKNR